jgi:calcineurin-like phosphoesterase family protein
LVASETGGTASYGDKKKGGKRAMGRTFYTSDLHFGHERIIELCNRPFDSVQEMNEELIRRWNETVGTADTVYMLGDIVMGKLDDNLPLVSRLNGLKMLIPGNHDRVWPGYNRKGVREQDLERYWDAGFFMILDSPWKHRNGWTLCHFPDVGDSHEEDRFASWRPSTPQENEILVHGHVHEEWKFDGNRVNVGVDVWDFRPVPERVIEDWARTRGWSPCTTP